MRKNCEKLSNDIGKAECCENQVCKGAGLSCCGGQAFNPEGSTKTAVTVGLSCCGTKSYNQLNEMCCQSTVVHKPVPKAQCCGEEAFDVEKQLCCGPKNNKTVVTKNSTENLCCGREMFNTRNECCCVASSKMIEIQPINSSCCKNQSALCEKQPYNTFHQLCCDYTVVNKTVPHARCCGKEAFDEHEKLCCGPHEAKSTQCKISSGHLCCGKKQYDPKIEYCSEMDGNLKPELINSSFCKKDSDKHQQKPSSLHICNKTENFPSSKFLRCCDKKQPNSQQCCASEKCDGVATVYDPSTHICCNGCVTEWKPWKDQCCGKKSYGLAQRGVLCCKDTLYRYRNDGEVCSKIGIPYDPAGWTFCGSKFHPSPKQHCCGSQLYHPEEEICCHGHSHAKTGTSRCCGVNAYNISDPRMKCCEGTLHNLTHGHSGQAQCCGSRLETPMSVCCSSEVKKVLYSIQTGFGCCGHLHYNASLWSCCAGMLTPAKNLTKRINESKLLSVNNLNESHLFETMHIGAVESVSPDSIVFRDVLKIHGRNFTVTPLALPHILNTPDHCSFPKLTPGKIYFFDGKTFFADVNHGSVLQSLHFIISKCYLT
ncbi:hypothetical protein PBY51_009669 [Eleginops maclovinus]|uniref:Galaxin-like repeats domain-containing protein n=1 Tax=Eleginops maclovinus TaxID=56733 RepID=A0AAN7XZ00_ELEMC|nr:hypothetical protein PBY51_009669 [Eleginops maclovinus]